MSDDLSVEIEGLDELDRLLQEFPKRLGGNLRIGMRKGISRYRRRLIDESPVLHPHEGRARKRARTLSATITWKVKGRRLQNLEGVIKTESFAAYGLETGESYKAKSGKYLVIPIGFALSSRGKRAGRPKKRFKSYAKFVQEVGLKSLSFTPTKNRGWIVWLKRFVGRARKDGTRKAKYQPIYVMVRSADPEPKLGMFKIWDANVPKILEALSEGLEAALQGIDLK
ncbi:MAG: hypothetical protein DHS20C21_18490 [Gemmatimonadota bacterium]|nr:MAG: hypothetical protein DHS20C21_18490 [Gemmatimonadota bacterium]